MKETVANKLITTWHELHAERHQVDHAIARLCFEIRNECANDVEALQFIVERIGAKSIEARSGLVKAQAWEAVRNVEHWKAIGGLPSARYIATLTKKQRLIVLPEAISAADKQGTPVSVKKVKDIAWRHGFAAKEEPATTIRKQNAELLADLRRLVNTGVVQLSQLSASVRAIVKPTAKAQRQAA
jgi:hypothetical protein